MYTSADDVPTMEAGAGVALGVAVDVGPGVAVGVSIGVVVGTGVAVGVGAGTRVLVGSALEPVTAVDGPGSSPQETAIARAHRAARYSSSTAEAIPVPVGMPQINFMAQFSAPGTVESMPRRFTRLASGWNPPVPVAGCVPWDRQWQKNTRPGERA